ncbi:cytochrome P450 [Multifurca ochricompacta]|uniref:Cytochrome P450 n=1 Tax=Multifurca ochricompacta TaxID=376703 RepID=A0AAD4QKP4_9AGAM|nr:cytochrome P450 [Multifurca ochricompacta]
MPTRDEWATFQKWSKDFGSDIVHVTVFGTHIVILNSAKAANELLDGRSAIYSDRPAMPALTTLIDMEWNFGLIEYGTRWRNWRKAFHAYFNPQAAENFHPIELKGAHRLLRNLLATPDNLVHHMRHMAGQVILAIAYGIDVAPSGDRNVESAEKAVGAIIAGSLRGRIFDLFPFLVKMPWWFPGAGFKKEAQTKWVPHVQIALHAPYETVKGQMAAGTAKPSVASSMISELNDKSSEEEIFTSMAIPATMYLVVLFRSRRAGYDRFCTPFLLPCDDPLPEVQRKGQAEIDAVVGKDRLPDFGDEPLLPYVSAILEEALRWHPVVPLAIPHRLTTDDVYEGWLLPAGTLVIGNSWGILHDEANVGSHPEQFIPERYLPGGDATVGTADVAFGYGRRICPGRYMGRATDWIAIASVLATFNISPARDKLGREIIPEEIYESGLAM